MILPIGIGLEKPPTLKEAEKALIEWALVYYKGNVVRAARELGIPKSSFYTKIKKHQINFTRIGRSRPRCTEGVTGLNQFERRNKK